MSQSNTHSINKLQRAINSCIRKENRDHFCQRVLYFYDRALCFCYMALLCIWLTHAGKHSMSRDHKQEHLCQRLLYFCDRALYVCYIALQGGEDALDALTCRSLSAKEPIIIWLFCEKWPTKIRHPMRPRHPLSDSRTEEKTEYQGTTKQYFVCGHTLCFPLYVSQIQRVESDSYTEEKTEDQKERLLARPRRRNSWWVCVSQISDVSDRHEVTHLMCLTDMKSHTSKTPIIKRPKNTSVSCRSFDLLVIWELEFDF